MNLIIPITVFALIVTALVAQRIHVARTADIGDEVTTTAGIVGTITGTDGPKRLWIEVDDDVQLRIARNRITKIVHYAEEEQTDAPPTT